MKAIIIFNLLAITTINPIANAHENHDHQIYNWPTSKNNPIEKDSTFNNEKSKVIKNKTEANTKSSWIKFFRR